MLFMRCLGLIAALLARCIIFFAGLSFLLKLTALVPLNLALTRMVIRGSIDAELLTAIRLHLYSLGLLMLSAYLLMLAIYGLYVALFSSKRGVTMLAYLTAITFIVCLLSSLVFAPNLERLEDETLAKLREYQAQYEWMSAKGRAELDHKEAERAPVSRPEARATLVWDLVQANLDCCGLKSPDDWARFEPSKRLLPASCCRNESQAADEPDGFCRTDMPHWSRGCSHEVHIIIDQLIDIMGSTIYYTSLMFCFLMCLVLLRKCCEPDESYISYSNGAATTTYSEIVYDPGAMNARLVADARVHLYPRLNDRDSQPESLYARYGSY